ncbi:MAG: zinc dependent phospholipase C family protein [Lachnospiraceae bacterium]|nr:zinc dependent phospholipase C family protein [Lachnospiraceae bacterium]
MQTEDHYLLSKKMMGCLKLGRSRKAAFSFGNIEPDFNRFSYMGRKKEHFGNGHSYQCRKKEIFVFFQKPYEDSILWWYRAGKAFHYLTDSFSRPHNPEFRYKSAAHIKYEIELHDLTKRVMQNSFWEIPRIEGDLMPWLEQRHRQYMGRTKGIKDDCYYIYTTVMAVWNWVMEHKLNKSGFQIPGGSVLLGA